MTSHSPISPKPAKFEERLKYFPWSHSRIQSYQNGRSNGILWDFEHNFFKLCCFLIERAVLLFNVGDADHVATAIADRATWVVGNASVILLDTDVDILCVR